MNNESTSTGTRKATLGAILLLCAVTTPPAMAQNSVQHSGQASQHVVEALGHTMVGGAKLVSGAVAIPLGVAGSVGQVSGQMAGELTEAANAPIGEPLPITDDTVTAAPAPAEAMKRNGTGG